MGRAGRWRMLAMGAVLAVVLCVSAGAEEVDEDALEERCTGEWYWKLHPDGYAIVTGTVYTADRARFSEIIAWDDTEPFVMPSELEGYSVKEIDSYAFLMANLPDHIILPEGLTIIRKNAFDESAFKTITIPSTVTTIEPSAFPFCLSLEQFKVEEGNPSYKVLDGLLLSADGEELIACPAWLECSTLTVPHGVEVVHECAFTLAQMQEIIFPEGLTTICDHAVCDCRELNKVIIPSSIQSIGKNAFHSPTGAEGRIILKGFPQLLGEYAFSFPEVQLYLNFLPDAENPYHFSSAEELLQFVESGRQKPEPVPDPEPDAEPEAPPPPKVEDEEPEVPPKKDYLPPPAPESSHAGWWVLAGAAALAAGWVVVRKIRPPKSGGRR